MDLESIFSRKFFLRHKSVAILILLDIYSDHSNGALSEERSNFGLCQPSRVSSYI